MKYLFKTVFVMNFTICRVLWRLVVYDWHDYTTSQGSEPKQGDPAAPGPSRRPAALHLQFSEGSPNGEGPAARVGGGGRLERSTARVSAPCERRRLETLCVLAVRDSPRFSVSIKRKINKRKGHPRVIPFNLGMSYVLFHAICEPRYTNIFRFNYCTPFHPSLSVYSHCVLNNVGLFYFYTCTQYSLFTLTVC